MVKKRIYKLTANQEKFCTEYLVDFNATQAAIRAGYSAKTANKISARLLVNVGIQEKISAIRKADSEKAQITRETQLADLQTAKKIALETKQLKPFISAIAEQNKLLGLYEADRLDLSNTDGSLKTPVVNFIIDGTVKDG